MVFHSEDNSTTSSESADDSVSVQLCVLGLGLRFLLAFVAGGVWCLMFVVVSVRLVLWKCPSCGHYFRGRIFGPPNASASLILVRIVERT